ncbi:hypothetical protein [Nostoc sp.]|uniref:hypothetical protein n=1 Tax=Nostoc sp. TaxID=1180 RepID=UPI002FF57543
MAGFPRLKELPSDACGGLRLRVETSAQRQESPSRETLTVRLARLCAKFIYGDD